MLHDQNFNSHDFSIFAPTLNSLIWKINRQIIDFIYLCGDWLPQAWQVFPDTVFVIVPSYSLPNTLVLQPEMKIKIIFSADHTDIWAYARKKQLLSNCLFMHVTNIQYMKIHYKCIVCTKTLLVCRLKNKYKNILQNKCVCKRNEWWGECPIIAVIPQRYIILPSIASHRIILSYHHFTFRLYRMSRQHKHTYDDHVSKDYTFRAFNFTLYNSWNMTSF